MMRSRLRLSGALFVPAIIIIVGGAFFGGERLLEISRGAMLSVCAGVAAAHYPFAKQAFGPKRPLDEIAVLSLGWFLFSISIVFWCSWYLIWRSMGSPALWWDEYLLCGFAYLTVTGGVLVLMVAHATNGVVQARAWWSFGIRTSVTVAVVLAIISVVNWLGGGIGPP